MLSLQKLRLWQLYQMDIIRRRDVLSGPGNDLDMRDAGCCPRATDTAIRHSAKRNVVLCLGKRELGIGVWCGSTNGKLRKRGHSLVVGACPHGTTAMARANPRPFPNPTVQRKGGRGRQKSIRRGRSRVRRQRGKTCESLRLVQAVYMWDCTDILYKSVHGRLIPKKSTFPKNTRSANKALTVGCKGPGRSVPVDLQGTETRQPATPTSRMCSA